MSFEQIYKRRFKFEFAPFLLSKEEYLGFLLQRRMGPLMSPMKGWVFTVISAVILNIFVFIIGTDLGLKDISTLPLIIIIFCIFIVGRIFAQTEKLWHLS